MLEGHGVSGKFGILSLLRVMVTSSEAVFLPGFSPTNNNISLVGPRDCGAFLQDEIRWQFNTAGLCFGV